MMKNKFGSPMALMLLCAACALATENKRPNIVILLADDLGWADLGYQGSKDIRTPHIDQLASQSIQFTDGHTTASVCSPSRAGLITGRYQQRFGHEANSPPKGKGMRRSEQTLAGALNASGYRTGIVGKWHLGNGDQYYPTRRGFDYFYGLRDGSRGYFYNAKREDRPGSNKRIEENGQQRQFDGYLTDVLGEKAIDFIGDRDTADKPFFLFLSFTAPHGPMHATEDDLQRFASISDPRRRTYAAMVWAMDRAIGRVISHLKSTGRYNNTLIWFLSDNGGATNNASINLPLAGHKGIKFEGGIRVPMLLRWGDRYRTGRQYSPMVSALDILPTSLVASGASSLPENLDGVNLLPYLDDSNHGVPHERLYWHKLWFSAMREGPWKLIYVQDYGYALYDLSDDLSEANNVLAKHTERFQSMRQNLDRWKAQMASPEWGEAEVWFQTHSKNHIRIIEQNQ